VVGWAGFGWGWVVGLFVRRVPLRGESRERDSDEAESDREEEPRGEEDCAEEEKISPERSSAYILCFAAAYPLRIFTACSFSPSFAILVSVPDLKKHPRHKPLVRSS
jgi:hypothetical protein